MYLYLNSTDMYIYIYESDVCILYTPLLFDLSRQLPWEPEVFFQAPQLFQPRPGTHGPQAEQLVSPLLFGAVLKGHCFQQILQVTLFWKNLSPKKLT